MRVTRLLLAGCVLLMGRGESTVTDPLTPKPMARAVPSLEAFLKTELRRLNKETVGHDGQPGVEPTTHTLVFP